MSFVVERRTSTVNSLKEIIVFLAALTFTNAFNTFLFDEHSRGIRPIEDIRPDQWICLILLLCGVFRFYHGNWRLLDDNYNIKTNRGGLTDVTRRNIIWLDFICVLIVALNFALLSFFVNSFSKFIVIYFCIIVIDIV
jgi:hypothetical protein